MNLNNEVVILAYGTFPSAGLANSILKKAKYLICCDGAANELIASGIIPTVIIGDGDSLSNEFKVRFEDILVIDHDQETNDLTKAVHFLAQQGKTSFTILGATGKREDHTLGNISLLMDYHEQYEVTMVTEYGIFQPCTHRFKANLNRGQQVSIFNFGSTKLEAIGLKYPVRAFKKLWEGTLNEVVSDSVEIKSDGNFLVYITHCIKHSTL